MRMFNSLRVRLVAILLLAILPSFGLIIWDSVEDQERVTAEAKENALKLVRLIAAEQEKHVQETRQLLAGIAHMPAVRSSSSKACGDFLAELLSHYPIHANIAVWNPDGTIRCSAVPMNEPLNASNLPWFRYAIDNGDFRRGFYSTGLSCGRAMIVFAYPVLNDHNDVEQIVSISLIIARLNEFASKAKMPDGSAFMVIDSRGTILCRNREPEKWVGKVLTDAPVTRAILSTQEEGVAEVEDLDGVSCLYAFSPLGNHPDGSLYAAIGIPRTAVIHQAERSAVHSEATLAIVTALALLAMWFGGKYLILAHVENLLTVTKQLSGGDLNVRSGPPYPKGELGELALAFDRMGASLDHREKERKRAEEELKKSRDELEMKVVERTAELKKLNMQLREEIEERKEKEKALEESEASLRKMSLQLNTLLNAIPDTLMLLSKDLKLIWANNGAAYRLDKTLDDIIGRPCYEVVYGSTTPCGDCISLSSVSSGNFEESITRYDGRLLEKRVFPIIEDGEVSSILFVAKDITDKVSLQAEAMQAAHLASIGELASGVAHEINNPLNGIINYAQIIVNRSAKESREGDIASRIVSEGERIACIVRELLSFARPDSEGKRPSDIRELFLDSMVLLNVQMRKDGITLRTDFPEDLPTILANSKQIRQVFLNILNNARYALNQKYRGAHENKVLEVSCERVGHNGETRLRVNFHDHGTGVPSDILKLIGNPFFSTKPNGKGTGLGLSISRRIVQEHGGDLTVESIEGEFTKVIIDLPLGGQP